MGQILEIILSFLFAALYSAFRGGKKNIKKFRQMVEKKTWNKEIVDNKYLWVCKADNTYTIEVQEVHAKDPQEKMQAELERFGYRQYKALLRADENPLKEILFISRDEGRTFMPLSAWQKADGKEVVFREVEPLEDNVAKVISGRVMDKS